jgi:hypothetical protein
MGPLGSAATEGVDSPGPRDRLTTVPESLWNEIFLSGFDGNASAINDQGVTALYDNPLLIA